MGHFGGVIDTPAQIHHDMTLVRQAQSGDTAAFEALARSHVRWVIGLIRQNVGDLHDAEDAAQETFLSAYENLNQLKDPAAFSNWLHTIAVRKAHERRARKKVVVLERDDEVSETPSFTREQLNRVRRAVAELDAKYRIVVTLRYLENLEPAEIAARLQIPDGTVRARLHRALPLLQQKLRDLI